MSLIIVNRETCVKCGACVQECPTAVLSLGENGPQEVKPQACIACGHCVAVCPTAAIDNCKTPLEEQKSLENAPSLNEEQMEAVLRRRRSIRNYKQKPVPKEILTKLVNIARFAPTGSNSQGISYIVVQNKEVIKKLTESCIEMLENSSLRSYMGNMIQRYREDGLDVVLRDAPCLVLAVADKNMAGARGNAISALTYLELYAPSFGLGSCWAGIFERCVAEENSPLLQILNVPQEKQVAAAVMVGYPTYSYKRLPERNPLELSFIE